MTKFVKISSDGNLIMCPVDRAVVYTFDGQTYLTVAGASISMQLKSTHDSIKAMETIKEACND